MFELIQKLYSIGFQKWVYNDGISNGMYSIDYYLHLILGGHDYGKVNIVISSCRDNNARFKTLFKIWIFYCLYHKILREMSFIETKFLKFLLCSVCPNFLQY